MTTSSKSELDFTADEQREVTNRIIELYEADVQSRAQEGRTASTDLDYLISRIVVFGDPLLLAKELASFVWHKLLVPNNGEYGEEHISQIETLILLLMKSHIVPAEEETLVKLHDLSGSFTSFLFHRWAKLRPELAAEVFCDLHHDLTATAEFYERTKKLTAQHIYRLHPVLLTQIRHYFETEKETNYHGVLDGDDTKWVD